MARASTRLENAGTLIGGRYVLEAGLGQGGMAAVYRVLDSRTGKTLALKRGLASDPRKQKKREALLQREYYTLCQLAHPRIIEVYDYGVDESGPYYVMELLHGSDLGDGEDWLGRKPACCCATSPRRSRSCMPEA